MPARRVGSWTCPCHSTVRCPRRAGRSRTGPRDSVTLTTPARLPLILERRMRLAPDRATLLIEETVRLDADVAVPYLWGHHPAWLAPEGAQIDLPDGIRIAVDAGYATEHADLLAGGSGAWPQAPARAGGTVDLGHVGAGPTERLAYLSGFVVGRRLGCDPGRRPPGSGRGHVLGRCHLPHAWFWWEIGGPGSSVARALAASSPSSPIPRCPRTASRRPIARGEAHRLEPGQDHRRG